MQAARIINYEAIFRMKPIHIQERERKRDKNNKILLAISRQEC